MRHRCLLPLLVCAACAVPARMRADTPEEQIAAASALIDAKRYEEAAPVLDAFLAKNPKHPQAGAVALALGQCRSELKQYPPAIAAYTKAIASKDNSIMARAELGLAQAAMQTKQYDKAADALQEAVKEPLRPEQAALAYYWLGESDYRLKRWGQARDAYGHVVSDYGKSDLVSNALYGAALAAIQDSKPDEAKPRLRTLLDRYRNSKDRGQALLLISQIDLDSKNYGEARRDFEDALRDRAVQQDDTLKADVEDGLIQCLLAQKDYGQAAPHLENALQRLAPDNPQRFRAALSLGNCRYQEKQYDRALNAYQIAAGAKEETVAAQGLYWSANAQLGQNKPDEAAPLFANVATRFPKDKLAPKAQLKAGDAWGQAKKAKEASTAYQVVVDKYPQSPEAVTARTKPHRACGRFGRPRADFGRHQNGAARREERGTFARGPHLPERQKSGQRPPRSQRRAKE